MDRLCRRITLRGVAVALMLGLSVPTFATQVCTLQQKGGKAFTAIDGTSDTNVFATSENGKIWQYDGSSWANMPNTGQGSNTDLFDVAATGSTGFAVGASGAIRQLSGSKWSKMNSPTSDDIYGVWAASSSEVYIGGANGNIYAYNGSSWSNQTSAANTNGDDIVDVWGDADTVYAVDSKGVLYRYDRNTSAWLVKNTACTIGDDFRGIWGDTTGDLYLVAKEFMYRFDGSSCSQIVTANAEFRSVFGWSDSGEVTGVGKDGLVLEYESGSTDETTLGTKELTGIWVSPTGNAYIASEDKRVAACTCSDCSLGNSPEFLITHDSNGIHCAAENVQVLVRDSGSGVPITSYTDQITLDTQSGRGTWSLVTGSGILSDSTANDGLATYNWANGETTATFSLYYPEGAATINVDVYETSDTAVRDTDTEGDMSFSASGFTVTPTALANPPPGSITPFNAPQIAGTNFAIHIAAFGQTPGDAACGIIETYTGSKTLGFWATRQDPASGTIVPTIDGLAIGVVEGGATDTSVTFVDGQAAVLAKYKDVGLIQISMKDTSPTDPDLPNGIRGATSGFVVKPYDFLLSNIEDASSNPNPGSADASGDIFVAAGESFSATVTARDAEGSVTPNYGQESIAESVSLVPSLVAPAGGNLPAVAASTGFASFANGVSTGNDFSWPEVGVITLQPEVGDGDYLGAGNVTGVATGNVGRFIPHRFETSLNTPTFGTACAAGNFTYLGQPFSYTSAPEVTFTATALGGEVTQNYDGAFFKMTTASLADPVYAATSGSLDTSGLPGGSSDPAVASLGSGQGTLTFSSGSGLFFSKGSEMEPFDAEISLAQTITDSDGVAASSNPVRFGVVGGIIFNSGAEMRFGRLAISNAYGSELIDLPVRLRSEYYAGAAAGFLPNTVDACTTPVTIALGGFTENLGSGATCVMDSGSPGESGAGCATAASPGKQFRVPPTAGNFNLYLAAPGAGNDGSVDVTADAPSWLEYDWNTSTSGTEDPTATAVFGIFEGRNKVIYTRELF